MTSPTDADPTVFEHVPPDPPTDPHLRVPTAPPPRSREGLGTAALVLGIVGVVLSPSVVLGLVLGLLAVILGLVARGRVRRGEAFNGRATTAGIVLGAVALVVAVVVGVLVATNLPRLTAELGGAPTGTAGVQQCVRNANGDRAAVRQCRQQAGGGARHGAQRRPGDGQAPRGEGRIPPAPPGT